MSDTPAEAGDAEEITPVEDEGDETEAETEVEDPDDE